MQLIETTDEIFEMVHIPLKDKYLDILTPEALEFVYALCGEFEPLRQSILKNRIKVKVDQVKNTNFTFFEDTRKIREGNWKISEIPEDLMDRKVEIIGPPHRKTIINALNSGAKTYVADFEDSNSPTFENSIGGQINLKDCIRNNIDFYDYSAKKQYRLCENPAVLIVRPRGWHLTEKNVMIDGKPVSASILDFALYFFHNVVKLLEKGTAPYFYLPKIEHYLEARLWNKIFIKAQQLLSIPQKTIKAAVLIETLPAVFQMDEIIYELRNHIVALNCGRWDYIFSMIKHQHNNPLFKVPDRSSITMESHCMQSYSKLLIHTAHRRGVLAIGGMAAQIPVKNNQAANLVAFNKIKNDKFREVQNGHDGTWVSHPGLVPLVLKIFDEYIPLQNQMDRDLSDVNISEKDLLVLPEGGITRAGIETSIRISLCYLANWIGGIGSVPINNIMEDAASLELSRSQIWHWLHKPKGQLETGELISLEFVQAIIEDESEKLKSGINNISRNSLKLAEDIFSRSIRSDVLEEFITLSAYKKLEAEKVK